MFLQLAGGSDCVLLARAEEGLPDGAIALSAVQQHNLHLNAGTAAEFRCAAGLHCIVQGGGCRHQAEAAPDSALRPLHFFRALSTPHSPVALLRVRSYGLRQQWSGKRGACTMRPAASPPTSTLQGAVQRPCTRSHLRCAALRPSQGVPIRTGAAT